MLELLLFVYPHGYFTRKLLTIVLFDKTSASTAYVVIYYDIVTIVCKAFQLNEFYVSDFYLVF